MVMFYGCFLSFKQV